MTIYLPLQHGVESSKKIDLLCSLTSFREVMTQALHLYYVNGWSVEFICTGDILKSNNVHAGMTTLDQVNRVIHKIRHSDNPSEAIELILSLISFREKSGMRDILYQHLANHVTEQTLCKQHGISTSNFRKALKNYRNVRNTVHTLINMS